MLRRLLVPLFLTGVVGLAVAAEVVRTTSATAGGPAPGTSPIVARAAAAKSTTAKATTAAKAFLASLSSAQQAKILFSFGNAAKQKGWSNLPTGLVARNGVKIADMTTAQQGKLRTLLKAVLSSNGFSEEQAIRQADTYLNQQQQGGSGGAQNLQYGEGLYYVAFFGRPSTTRKWTVQFGGHHLAIHMTFSGSSVSNTPYFVGVEPRAAFTVNGKTYQPLKTKASALFGAVRALSASQLAGAKLSQSFDDVLVGPQKDGSFPSRQGVTVGSLSSAQQKKVTAAIKAYLGDMPASQANARLRQYEQEYSHTKLAWAGNTDGTTRGAYARIHGPRVWIEIAVQNGIVLSGTHYHSIERDIKHDYGAGT